jgi:hypothetical protein
MRRADRGGRWLALALVCASGGACVLDASAEVPPIAITLPGITLPGNPLGAALGDVALATTFTDEVGELALPAGLVREVRVLDIAVASSDGVTDLGFIRRLRVLIRGTGQAVAALDPVEVAAYDRDDRTLPAGATLLATGGAAANLLAQWNAQPLAFTVEATGVMPPAAWTIDVTMRVAVKIAVEP